MTKAHSVQEAAARCGVSVFAIRRWIVQRRLAVHRLGRRVVISEEDLTQFLSSHRVPAREGTTGGGR
jgi:excisionase family DNA binding protein